MFMLFLYNKEWRKVNTWFLRPCGLYIYQSLGFKLSMCELLKKIKSDSEEIKVIEVHSLIYKPHCARHLNVYICTVSVFQWDYWTWLCVSTKSDQGLYHYKSKWMYLIYIQFNNVISHKLVESGSFTDTKIL